MFRIIVEEELPLKQGLKLYCYVVNSPIRQGVEEELPLKQGLKHALKYSLPSSGSC